VRLIELGVRLPDRLRVDRGGTKAVLRRAIGRRLPQAVSRRLDKGGFQVPQRAWLAAARAHVADLVRGGQVVQRGWVSAAEVEHVLDDGFGCGRGTGRQWRLFIVEAWLGMRWPDAPGIGGRVAWAAATEAQPTAAGRAMPA
jgi:asparagine synthase (glutamine-hydrolysing)